MTGREARFYVWRKTFPGGTPGSSAGGGSRRYGNSGRAGRNGSADDSSGLFWCRRTAAGNSSRWCRSLCSGWIAAFCKKERGLLCGLVQGLFYAALLVVLSVPSGTLTEEPPLLRFAVLILCGSIGGLLGMVTREKKRRS
ncbi:MAG: TIGR04086 family membrane protein [Faecalibacterium prausnitzii]